MEYHENEVVLYDGGPSQVANYSKFFACAFLFLVAIFAPTIWNKFLAVQYAPFKEMYTLASKALFFIPIIMAFSAWIKVRCHKYVITNERLSETVGVLSKTTDELELFRVKDISYSQPFFFRLFGCGDIILDTSDRSTQIVVLHAIKDGKQVANLLRKNVQVMRAKRGVREID